MRIREHNHVTRAIMPKGMCPACDATIDRMAKRQREREQLPPFHETRYEAGELVGLAEIARMPRCCKYDQLRSLATYRREWSQRGEMPRAVCQISGRRLWLKADIEHWLRNLAPETFDRGARPRA